MNAISSLIGRLSTPLKLLIALTLALLPIGVLITWSVLNEIDDQRASLRGATEGEMIAAARASEALIARNVLALRVASYGALRTQTGDPCEAARDSLEATPALDREFVIRRADGELLCGGIEGLEQMASRSVALGTVGLEVADDGDAVLVSIGIPEATTVGQIDRAEFLEAIDLVDDGLNRFTIRDNNTRMVLLEGNPDLEAEDLDSLEIEMAGGRLFARASAARSELSTRDRATAFLPIAMWLLAALLTWWLVHVLLLRPLARLNEAVRDYDVDTHTLDLPEKLGPAREIRELGASFVGTVDRIEESENAMFEALEGQRKLIREVHHRVKNNLQVVASLLNIHSRGVEGEEAREAYTGIGRRVEALSVVHRNHFAEIEESRGIQMRPLLTELGTSLRASSPDSRTDFDLDLDSAATTQDAAVSAAFFVTEVVEHALRTDPNQPIEIALRRSSELTARLSIASRALVESAEESGQHVQFERIVEGLSRQLRSPLDKKLGAYSVEIPVFPPE